MPSRKRLGRDPDCEAAPLLECPVVRRPVADLVARRRDLVTARLMDLVEHRSSGERGDGPIHSTVALPKPEAVILHQRPWTSRADPLFNGPGNGDLCIYDGMRNAGGIMSPDLGVPHISGDIPGASSR